MWAPSASSPVAAILVHQARLAQLAREASRTTVQHVTGYERQRRHATLVATMLDITASMIDQAIDLFDRLVGAMFRKAEGRQARAFQADARAINEKVRLYARVGAALIAARDGKGDAYRAITSVIWWSAFAQPLPKRRRWREAIHAATHVGDAGSEPDPYAGGRDDHPRSTDMTRRSATRLTSLPTRTHVPSDSSISIRSASAAASLPGDGADDTTGSVAIGGTAPVTCIGMNIGGGSAVSAPVRACRRHAHSNPRLTS